MSTGTLTTTHQRATQAEPQPRSAQRYVLPVLLVLVGVVNVLMMPRVFLIGDPFCWREETRSILRDGSLAVDPRVADELNVHVQGQSFDLNPNDGRWYSKFGIMNSLMALPPMLAEKLWTGALPSRKDLPNVAITGYWGVLLSLIVCWLLWGLTARYSRRPLSRALYVLGVFYATYFWYYQRSQGAEIYQAMYFIAFFYLFVGYLDRVRDQNVQDADRLRLLGAWLFLAMLIYTRLFFGLLMLPSVGVIAYVIWTRGKDRLRVAVREGLFVIIPLTVILAGLGYINYVKFGSPWASGYDQWEREMHLPVAPLRDGLWGMLFDAKYSIFAYFPPLALALPMYAAFWRRFRIDTVAVLSCAAVYILVLAKIPTWRGEWTYGPRYVVFILPVLSMPFLLLIDWIIDGARDHWNARVVALATAAVLVCSGFFQFQVDRLDFFFLYRVQLPIGSMDQELAHYFEEHNSAILYWDFIKHRDNLDAIFVFDRLKHSNTTQQLQFYRQVVKDLLEPENFYWWSKNPPSSRQSNSLLPPKRDGS
jgi:hypothetical protein